MTAARPRVDLVFNALGDPTRRAILERLSQGPLSASDLVKPLGISLAAVVQHLQVLERSGLASTQKTGRVRTCRLNAQGFSIVERWIADRRTSWEQAYDRLGRLLEEEKG